MRRAAAGLAALLAACTTGVPPPPHPVPVTAAAPVAARSGERLLASLARYLAMDPRALAEEVARARRPARGPAGAYERVEAALAITVSGLPEEARVAELVAPVAGGALPSDPELRAMAGFLQGMATERRKLREGLATAAAKSREERRETHSQRSRAEAQQERADALQRKLEALTNLEKSLADRPHADDPDPRPR